MQTGDYMIHVSWLQMIHCTQVILRLAGYASYEGFTFNRWADQLPTSSNHNRDANGRIFFAFYSQVYVMSGKNFKSEGK